MWLNRVDSIQGKGIFLILILLFLFPKITLKTFCLSQKLEDFSHKPKKKLTSANKLYIYHHLQNFFELYPGNQFQSIPPYSLPAVLELNLIPVPFNTEKAIPEMRGSKFKSPTPTHPRVYNIYIHLYVRIRNTLESNQPTGNKKKYRISAVQRRTLIDIRLLLCLVLLLSFSHLQGVFSDDDGEDAKHLKCN